MFGNQENTLWVEKFRPGTLDGYVGNEHIIDKVKLYIESGDVPHLLFYGGAGTGVRATIQNWLLKGFEGNLYTAFGSALHTVCEKVVLKEVEDKKSLFQLSFSKEINKAKKYISIILMLQNSPI